MTSSGQHWRALGSLGQLWAAMGVACISTHARISREGPCVERVRFEAIHMCV